MVTGKEVCTNVFNSTAQAVVAEEGDPTPIMIELEGALDARNPTGTMVKVRYMAWPEYYTPGLPHQGADTDRHHPDHGSTGPSGTTGMDAARTEALNVDVKGTRLVTDSGLGLKGPGPRLLRKSRRRSQSRNARRSTQSKYMTQKSPGKSGIWFGPGSGMRQSGGLRQ
jgi:hypothetical protein